MLTAKLSTLAEGIVMATPAPRIRGEIIPASGSTSVEEQLGLVMGGVGSATH